MEDGISQFSSIIFSEFRNRFSVKISVVSNYLYPIWFWLIKHGSVLSWVFGVSENIPLPNDYDADGKADLGVFRPNGAERWISRSTGGVFAESGNKPVLADFTAMVKQMLLSGDLQTAAGISCEAKIFHSMVSHSAFWLISRHRQITTATDVLTQQFSEIQMPHGIC